MPPWIAAAIAVLAAVACASTEAPVAERALQTREAPEDGDLLAVVPAEADVLLYEDHAQLGASTWTREALVSLAKQSHDGFDEATDVDRVIRVRLPQTGDDASLVIAQGRFERARVRAAWRARHADATASDFRGCTVSAAGGEALAFLTERTLLRGPTASVRAAIDTSLGRAPDVRRERWLDELDAALAAGRRGGRKPALVLAVRLGEEMRARLQREFGEGGSLERLGVRVDLGEGLDVTAVGATRDPKRAADLASRVEGELHDLRRRPSLAALGLVPVLESTRLAQRAALVRAEVHLRESERDEIAQRLAAVAALIAKGSEAQAHP